MFLFSLLCNKQQLNCTVPAVFILFVSYIYSVINLSMAKIENKSHLSTIRPIQLKAKKKKTSKLQCNYCKLTQFSSLGF